MCRMWCILYFSILGLSGAAFIDHSDILRASKKSYDLDTGEVQTFKSPKYPDNYKKNSKKTWEFTCSDVNANVKLTCEYFKTQSKSNCEKSDYIKVVDGTKDVEEIICGEQDPFTAIVSSDNYLKVKFSTNGDKKTKKGFKCSAECIIPTTTPKPTTSTSTTTSSSSTTSTTSTTTTSTTTSTTTTSSSTTSTTSTTTSTTTTSSSTTSTTSTTTSTTTTSSSTTSTTTTSTTTSTSSTTTSSTTTTPIPTTTTPIPTTTTPIPTTTTEQPSTTTPLVPTTTPVPPLECGVHDISPGKCYPIQSPKYPKQYCKKAKCTWEITCTAEASTIELSCDLFNTQKNSNCNKGDYVKVYDDTDLLDTACGKKNPFNPIVSNSNYMKIKFAANGDKTKGDGFDCCVKCIAITTTAEESTTTTPQPTTTLPSTSTIISSSSILPTTTVFTSTSTLISSSDIPSTSTLPSTSTIISSSSKSPTTTAISTTTEESSTEVTAATEDPADLPRLPCKCGVATNPDSDQHSLYNHPWTVALLDNSNKHFCSGTIINTYYILTSKSCVSSRGTSFKIRANEHELETGLPMAINRNPASVVTNGDLALIKMDVAISLTNYDAVKPACLPNTNKEFSGNSATHSGYDHGKCMKNDGTFNSGSSGDKLSFIPSAKAFCREDIGGPVVSMQDGKHYLAGIALDDPACASNGGISSSQDTAKVSSYFQWIMDNSNTGRFCER